MAETWPHRCESGESPDDAPWLTASQSRLLEIFSECCMIQKFVSSKVFLISSFLLHQLNRKSISECLLNLRIECRLYSETTGRGQYNMDKL